MLTTMQRDSFVGWPARRIAIFVRIVECDDPRQHHVSHLSFQREVRDLSLGIVHSLTPPSGWPGLLVLDDRVITTER